MTEIFEMLDKYLFEEALPDSGLHPHGLCEQAMKSDQVHPVTVDGRNQVSVNDKFDGQWFHRILSAGSAEDEDHSFGGKVAKKFSVRVRTVLMTKVKKGETLKYDFANALPESMIVDGYRLVDISGTVTMIEDQQAVYEQEFGKNSYERHILNWNITALEYNVEFIRCALTVCP